MQYPPPPRLPPPPPFQRRPHPPPPLPLFLRPTNKAISQVKNTRKKADLCFWASFLLRMSPKHRNVKYYYSISLVLLFPNFLNDRVCFKCGNSSCLGFSSDYSCSMSKESGRQRLFPFLLSPPGFTAIIEQTFLFRQPQPQPTTTTLLAVQHSPILSPLKNVLKFVLHFRCFR